MNSKQSIKEQGQREKSGERGKITQGEVLLLQDRVTLGFFSCFTLIFPPHSQGTGYTD